MKILAIISLVFFITECSAQIHINVTTSNFKNKTKVLYKGKDLKLVTDEEVALFNITHENLNKGVRIELGKVPDGIFLKDPTPYEDLFKKYKWPEVRRALNVKNAKIIEFIQQSIDIKTHVFINNTTMNIKSKTDMMQVVENTAISLWSTDGLPVDYISYNVSLDFGYANWTFVDKWRDEKLKSIKLTFGATKGTVDVNPGQTIVSTLTGIKVVMLLELEYTAKLVGNIITDYDRLLGKYHFYSPNVEKIMEAVDLENEILTREFLEVMFYTNPSVKVVDKDTGEELNLKLHFRKKGKYTFC